MLPELDQFTGRVARIWPTEDYDFEYQVEAWGKLPIVGAGASSQSILSWSADEIKQIFNTQRAAMPEQQSHKCGKFRQAFYTEKSTRKVLDYGCGSGFYAVELAKLGCQVSLADIRRDNLDAAARAMNAFGYEPAAKYLVPEYGLDATREPIDIFHSVGVLHHTPHIRSILRKAVEYLAPKGEVWLMLYSDRLFQCRTKYTCGSITENITTHPGFKTFVESCDPVGFYADWYNQAKLEYQVGDFLEVISFEYLGNAGETVVVKLRRKHG